MKVNPKTLAIESSFTPILLPTGELQGVFGIALDDEHNNVWVTNTRASSVSVYSQSGAHLKTLAGVAHSREVKVDEARDTAWVSAFGGSAVIAYDTVTYAEKARVQVTGSGPAGLVIDAATGTLYATDLTGDRIIAATVATATTPTIIPLPAGTGPISIDISPDGKTLFTANQGAGTVSFVDVATKSVNNTVPAGEGALAVAYDKVSDRLFAANRTAATVTVIDVAQGTVVKNLATSKNPNHVAVGSGNAWIVDKSGAGAGGVDQIYHLTFAP